MMSKSCSVREKKEKFDFIFDKIFWGFIMVIPLITFLFSFFSDVFEPVSLSIWFSDYLGVEFVGSVFEAIESLFVRFLPFFDSSVIIADIITWIIVVEYAHLIVDIIVFLPRLCHSWIDSFGRKLG